MEIKYREVKCPFCDHVFMWNEDGREGLIIHEYRLKENGKYIEKAKCPKCSEEMLVFDHILEGIELSDERVEVIGVRGI